MAPVGFAREPAVEVRRWIGRILLGALLAVLGFVIVNNVISPDDPGRGGSIESTLPAPR